jgi:exonuclease SbcD
MRFLHTSDWHVGKPLKGRSRLAEQRAVLAEIVGIARDQSVDAVLIAGDLYDSTAPKAEAQQLVISTLLELRETGAAVIAIAGNHDHAESLEAYRALAGHVGITLVGLPAGPDRGGVVSFFAPHSGERVNVAVLPFISQRYAVRAAALVADTPAQQSEKYDQEIRRMLEILSGRFEDGAVNLVMAHLTVTNGKLAGDERMAQTIFDYYVPASAFPEDAHYVALGHLHRQQRMPATCPVYYSGAPMMFDFGEESYTPGVCLVEATPTTPARVETIAITAGRRLRTVRGTVAELTARAASFGDDFLRVYVREPTRAGLTAQVQDVLPNAIHVLIDDEFKSEAARATQSVRAGRSPAELFGSFCAERGMADQRVEALFGQLLDQCVSAAEGE